MAWWIGIIACNVKRRNYLAYFYTHTYYHIIALAPCYYLYVEALSLPFEALSQFVVQGSGTCSAATRFGNDICGMRHYLSNLNAN
jgi:hypothetical protein